MRTRLVQDELFIAAPLVTSARSRCRTHVSEKPMPDDLITKCPSRPVLAQPSPSWTLLLTDSGTCFKVDGDGLLLTHQLPDLDGCSAVAVDRTGTLFAGLYDGMIATLRDDEWAYHAADAAVLSLAATPWGLAIGDAVGTVAFRDPPGPVLASALLGEPVVDLASYSTRGSLPSAPRGGLWRARLASGQRSASRAGDSKRGPGPAGRTL